MSDLHHLSSISKMIKLILIFVLCVAVHAKFEENFIKKDGYYFNLDLDDDRCCEDKCLATKNSKKISNAVLYVIHANKFSYEVLTNLRIIDFLYDLIKYQEFADHIKNSYYDYIGFNKLQILVNRYRVCGKVCKVYYQFRKAVIKHAADSSLEEIIKDDGTKAIKVTGELVILNDILSDLEYYMKNDPGYVELQIEATTFVADTDLEQARWHGKSVVVRAETVMVPISLIWDVSASLGT